MLLSTSQLFLYKSSMTIGPQVFEIIFQTFFRDLKILIFCFILINDLANNHLLNGSSCFLFSDNIIRQALRGNKHFNYEAIYAQKNK